MSHRVLPLKRPDDKPAAVPLIDLVDQFESIRDEVHEAVDRVFSSQRFVLGEEVAEFESAYAESCDARHAIGCASGSDALLLALMAHGVGPGDEVITTPFSFFATASAITRVGARPVFVDIDPLTYNIDGRHIESAVTHRTRAIIPVHLFGQCADMEPIWRASVRHGLAVIEDAAQAVGATYRGRFAGVLGTVGCFSFFPTKNLGGAGDGGMMTTDDPELAARLRRLRVHGDAGGYQHSEVGINSRLDALQAAVLSVKLKHLPRWTAARTENAVRYTQLFQSYGLLDRLELPVIDSDCGHVFNQYTVRVRDNLRDDVLKGLRDRNIGCSIYYPRPLHLQDCFADLGYKVGDYPEAERAAAEVLALPIFPELGEVRQERVVAGMAEVFAQIDAERGFSQRRAA